LRNSASTSQRSSARRPFQRVLQASGVGTGGGWTLQNSFGRTQALRGYVHAEKRSAIASGAGGASEDGGSTASGREPTWTASRSHRRPSLTNRGGGLGSGLLNWSTSDAASSALHGEIVEGEADFYRQRYVERASRRRDRQRSSSSAFSMTSDRSHMPPLPVDCLAPEDAADADDPGRPNPLMQQFYMPPPPPPPGGILDPTTGLFAKCGGVFELVECDYDARRIIWLTIPSKLSAVTEPFLKLVLIAIISHFIDTQSMVAFVLVISFVELTNQEVSGAIVDTEFTMIQSALTEGREATPFMIGQYMQLALNMQILIAVPILIMWGFVIDPLVSWLLSYKDPKVASLAARYTQVIIFDYLLQAGPRTFMFPFHMDGRKTFETVIDVSAKVITMIVIGVLAVTEENYDEQPTIIAIGVVQVIASCAKTIVKVAYVVFRGWFAPYQRGFFERFTLLVRPTRSRCVSCIWTVFAHLLPSLCCTHSGL